MEALNQYIDYIRRFDIRRKVLKPAVNLGLVISTALFIYNTLKIITNTEGPITVVLRYSLVILWIQTSRLRSKDANLTRFVLQ
jgi:hypothetical protein